MMHQQLLEKAQSKYLLSTEKKVYVRRIAIEQTAILGIHILLHKGCPLKYDFSASLSYRFLQMLFCQSRYC